jgi:hypothetical protein
MSDERTLGEKLISPHNLTNAEKDEDGVPVVVKVAARAIAQLRVTFILRGSLDETQLNELFDASALFAEWTREQHAELATLRDSKEVKVCPTKDIDDENIEDEFQRHIAKYGGKACYDEGFHCYRHNPCCHCGTSLSPDDTKEGK